MSAYAIGFYNIWDPSWRPAYRERIIALVAKYGGHFLVRPDCPTEVLEGRPPEATGLVVIEFPSMTAGKAWYNNPDYAPLRAIRQGGSTLDLILVEGLAEPPR